MVPEELRGAYEGLLRHGENDPHYLIVKCADKICAYIKCIEELRAGNKEFARAEESLKRTIVAMKLPEAKYFLDTFIPSIRMSLDDLGD